MKPLLWLALLCALNLADVGLTAWALTHMAYNPATGGAAEAMPMLDLSNSGLALKLAWPILFMFTVTVLAAQAHKEKAVWVMRAADAIKYGVVVFMAVVVANNVGVIVFHCGIMNLLGVI